jgi:hypothetical protein
MTTAKRARNQVKTTQNKEEKMNARRVVCVVCVLVVGLALALQSTALAGTPSPSNKVGEMPLYGGNGYPVVPRVNVPLYRAEDSKLPNFYRGWASNRSATPKVKQPHPGLLGNMYVVPEVRVPRYDRKDCKPK